jgi:hypothetical protein
MESHGFSLSVTGVKLTVGVVVGVEVGSGVGVRTAPFGAPLLSGTSYWAPARVGLKKKAAEKLRSMAIVATHRATPSHRFTGRMPFTPPTSKDRGEFPVGCPRP